MKKLIVSAFLLFATPALAATTVTQATLNADKQAVAVAKIAMAKQKQTNDAAMAAPTSAYQAALDALNVDQAQLASQNTASVSSAPIGGR